MSSITNIIRQVTATTDGCPAIDRLKAFRVDEGSTGILEHTFLGNDGTPADLTHTPPDVLPEGYQTPKILVRFREESGLSGYPGATYEVEANITDDANGVYQVAIPPEVTCASGISRVSSAYVDSEGNIAKIQNSLLSVEPSLFGDVNFDPMHAMGMPSLAELRMRLMDHASSNSLLDDVEFDDDYIIAAMTRPIQEFHNSPPPLSTVYTTRTFPWRDEWMNATIGYLLQGATHYYRRNRLTVAGAGLSDDKNNREAEYMRASQLLITQWRDWMARMKYSLNSQAVFGSLGG